MTQTQPHIPNPAAEPINRDVLENRADNVAVLLRQRVAATPDAPAFLWPDTTVTPEVWHTESWADVDRAARELGAGLIALGIENEQRVAIASGTRLEWALADLGVMVSGGATTTIYPTTVADDVAFILADSETRVVFAENAEQLAKLRSIREDIPTVSKVVLFDDAGVEHDDWTMTYAQLRELGAQRLAENPGLVDERIDGIKGSQLATLIYTSGTTGRPKGVRLLHRTWTYQGASVHSIGIVDETDLQYLWLPLSHVLGKQLLTMGLQMGYSTAIDGRIDKIVENLAVVKPTFMGAAPRIFEKVHAKITMMMEEEGGVKAKLFHWATGVGLEAGALRAEGKAPGTVLAAKHAVADKLVLSKIRDRFGGRIRFFISGSAALNRDVALWFDAMGLQIAEGYGLTESSSSATVNRVTAYKYGTVGWPLPETEVMIADDGEVLLRGPGIMDGYHNNPVATHEVMNNDGWFHTGDIGEVDDRGFLKITDRKKDLFKTSGGKYVAPALIESTFKGLCPYASQLIVHGDKRNFVSALVTLDPDAIAEWASMHGMADKSYAEIAGSTECYDMVSGYIDELNAGLNRWETIKKFTILDHDLSVEAGDLTPSLKLKRKVVFDKYQDILDKHYES